MTTAALPAAHRPRAGAFLAVWAVGVLALGALLVLRHEMRLPKSDDGPEAFRSAVEDTRSPAEKGEFLAIHVLASGCGCSARVLDRLLARRPAPGVSERIVWVGDGPLPSAANAEARGYHVETLTRDAARVRYHAESAPVLGVVTPGAALAYLGGYVDRSRSPSPVPEDLVARLAAGERFRSLPTFGCAIGKSLAARTNPLGL